MGATLYSETKRGYLVFEMQDGDEIAITFVPESETDIVLALSQQSEEGHNQFAEWADKNNAERIVMQTHSVSSWGPFNDYHIIKTFLYPVY